MKLKIIFFALITVLFSCKEEATCSSVVDAPIHAITSVDTMHVGEIQPIEIMFGKTNGCAKEAELKVTQNAFDFTVKVPVVFEGCVCTEVYGYVEFVYSFEPTEAGIYNFLVNQGDSVLTHPIVVL